MTDELLVDCATDVERWWQAALLLSADAAPGFCQDDLERQMGQLADRLPERVLRRSSPQRQANALAHLLAIESGFDGNQGDYADPRNSLVHEVVAGRLGIPITLSLIYAKVATIAGIPAMGVAFPRHFLLRIVDPGLTPGVDRSVIIDPFNGGSVLDEAALDELAERVSGHEEAQAEWLSPVPVEAIINRMYRNLRDAYRARGDLARVLLVTERLLELEPSAPTLRRDRGLLLHELGASIGALDDLRAYLKAAPTAGDAPEIRRVLEAVSVINSDKYS